MSITKYIYSISLCLLIATGSLLHSQDTLQIYFTHEYLVDSLVEGQYVNSISIGSLEMEDGYIICGLTGANSSIYIEKISKVGEVMWSQILDDTSGYVYNIYSGSQLIQRGDNIVLVYYMEESNSIFDGNIFVLEFTTDGEIVYNNEIDLLYSQEALCVTLSPTNNIVICGIDNYLIAGNPQPQKIFVINYNPEQEIFWYNRYYYNEGNKTLPISIVPTSDGNYMIGGDIQEDSNSGENFQHWVVKINEQGDTLWTKQWGDMSYNNSRVHLRPYNEYEFIGLARNFNPYNTDSFLNYFFVMDMDGNLTQEVFTETIGHGYYSDYLFPTSNSFITLGSSWNENFYFDLDISFLSNNFEMLEAKRIGYENTFSYICKDFDRTSDGGFIITGFTLPVGNPPPQKGFVFKIDSLGNYCSAWGCDSVVLDTTSYISYLQEFQEGRHTISTAPNPCSDHFTLSYNLPQEAENCWFRLFDTRGIERRSLRLSETMGSKEVQLSHCEAGIYYWKLVIGNRVIDTGKLVIR